MTRNARLVIGKPPFRVPRAYVSIMDFTSGSRKYHSTMTVYADPTAVHNAIEAALRKLVKARCALGCSYPSDRVTL